MKDSDTSSDAYKQAVSLASSADISIVVLGIDGSVEAETIDRPDVLLPGAQEQLLKDIISARTTTEGLSSNYINGTIVVLINGGPISCDYLKKQTDGNLAILEAFEGKSP